MIIQSETLQHIVSSCKSYLDQGRYTWRHDSVLNFIANSLSALPSCSIYADLPAFLSPSLVTGDSLRPDLLLIPKNKTLYILELTIGFETNIKVNSDRKALKYNPLHHSLRSTYRQINFINLSLGALGTVGSSSDSFSELLKAVDFDSVMKRIQPKHNNIKYRIYLFTKPGSSINSKLRYSLTTLNPQLLTRSPHVFSLYSHSDPVH